MTTKNLLLGDYIEDQHVANKLSETNEWFEQCRLNLEKARANGVDEANLRTLQRGQAFEWRTRRRSLNTIYGYRLDMRCDDSKVDLEKFLKDHPDTYLDPAPLSLIRDRKTAMELVPMGLYRGWKGHIVLVTGYSQDSETLEQRIEYREITGPGGKINANPEQPWSRLISGWLEPVNKDGYSGIRFTPVTQGRIILHIESVYAHPLTEAPATAYTIDGRDHLFTRRLVPI